MVKTNNKNQVDVLFMTAPIQFKSGKGDASSGDDTSTPPIGLLYIATFLNSKGYNCKILDIGLKGLSLAETIKYIKKINPRVVGISILTPSTITAVPLAREIKKEMPKIIIGCGDGAILFALKKRGLLKNKDVFAVDIAKERVVKTQKIDQKFHCFVADVCDLGKMIKKNSIDLAISSQVIEHIEKPERLIQQTKQVLKSGGHFYLSTAFKKWYGWYFYKNPKGKWTLDLTHLREYQHDDELIPLLKKFGFKVIHNKKILWKFPLTDFFLKRLGFGGDIYLKNKLLRTLRSIKLPILGYYYWEIVCEKIN